MLVCLASSIKVFPGGGLHVQNLNLCHTNDLLPSPGVWCRVVWWVMTFRCNFLPPYSRYKDCFDNPNTFNTKSVPNNYEAFRYVLQLVCPVTSALTKKVLPKTAQLVQWLGDALDVRGIQFDSWQEQRIMGSVRALRRTQRPCTGNSFPGSEAAGVCSWQHVFALMPLYNVCSAIPPFSPLPFFGIVLR